MRIEDFPENNNITRLKDWDVKIKAYKKDTKYSYWKSFLFIRKKYPEEGLLSSLELLPSTGYVIEGTNLNLVFLAMLLNSEMGKSFFSSGEEGQKINSRTIANLPIPAGTSLTYSSGGLLETYVMAVFQALGRSEDHKALANNVRVVYDFLHRIRNYYVMEMYIPEEFNKREISIISGWEEVINNLELKPEETTSLEKIVELFNTILSKGQQLLIAFNQMKVYQGELMKLLNMKLVELRN